MAMDKADDRRERRLVMVRIARGSNGPRAFHNEYEKAPEYIFLKIYIILNFGF